MTDNNRLSKTLDSMQNDHNGQQAIDYRRVVESINLPALVIINLAFNRGTQELLRSAIARQLTDLGKNDIGLFHEANEAANLEFTLDRESVLDAMLTGIVPDENTQETLDVMVRDQKSSKVRRRNVLAGILGGLVGQMMNSASPLSDLLRSTNPGAPETGNDTAEMDGPGGFIMNPEGSRDEQKPLDILELAKAKRKERDEEKLVKPTGDPQASDKPGLPVFQEIMNPRAG